MADLLGPANAPNAVTARPADARVFGADDTFFKGCSAPDVDDGTEVQADWLNGVLAQVRRAIRGMGIAVNNADDDMLLKAIQANGIRYAADTSLSANTIVVANAQPITAYGAGFAMLVKIKNDVTDAAVANVDGVGAKNVVHPDGTALTRGDWPKDAIGLVVYDGTSLQLLTVFYSQKAQQYGQCHLSLVGGNITLKPKDGRYVFVNGAFRQLPSAGLSASAAGLTPGTRYFVYVKYVAGVLALDFSTTGHATDVMTGAEVLSSDASWTLVGMIYVVAGPAFADTDGQLLVLSWFNRKTKRSRTEASGVHSTTSSSFVELGTELRNYFLTWGDEPVEFTAAGSQYATSGQIAATGIAFDGLTAELETSAGGSGAGAGYAGVSLSGAKKGLSEGYHYATLLGACVSGPGTASWSYSVAPYPLSPVSLSVNVKG